MLPGVTGVARLGATALATLALGGCSSGDDDKPEPARGAARQVATTVDRLERAVVGGDYRTICEKLFSASARRRAGGEDCPRLLRSTVRGVRLPRISIDAIRVTGDRAEVRVRSRAAGQPLLPDTLKLVREGGGYRVDSLR